MNVALMIAGIVLCVIGLALLLKPSGQSNFLGISFGGTNIQVNENKNVDHGTNGNKKTEAKWDFGKTIGLITAIIGLIAAIVSLFK